MLPGESYSGSDAGENLVNRRSFDGFGAVDPRVPNFAQPSLDVIVRQFVEMNLGQRVSKQVCRKNRLVLPSCIRQLRCREGCRGNRASSPPTVARRAACGGFGSTPV